MITAVLFIDPIFPAWLLLIAFGFTACWLLWLESKRKIRFRMLRFAAAVIASISMLCIAIRPYSTMMTHSNGVILLTQGYDPRIADSLAAANPSLEITAAPNTKAYGSVKTSDWDEIKNRSTQLRWVVGDGIPAAILDGVANLHYHFLPSKSQAGIVEINESRFFANRTNILSGKYYSPAAAQLLLIGPGGAEDSVTIAAHATANFKLRFRPRSSGKYNYELLSKERGDMRHEIVPLDILPEEKLTVLILAQAPSSEIRYLKNFLEEKNNSIVVRYKVSKASMRYEYFNHSQIGDFRITEKILKTFDLVIADNESFEHLNPSEQMSLEKEINNGMGLLLLSPEKMPTSRLFPFVIKAIKENDTLGIALAGHDKVLLRASTLEKNQKDEIHSVINSTNGKSVTAWSPVGQGRIGVMLLENTWSLALKEKSFMYADIWSPVIEQVARKNKTEFNISLTTAYPFYPDDPIHFEILSGGSAPTAELEGITIPLAEDPVWDDLWKGSVWTSKKGWHRLLTPQDSSFVDFYISAPGELSALSLARQKEANNKFYAESTDSSVSFTVNKPFPPLIFLVLAVLALGFLWLVPKL